MSLMSGAEVVPIGIQAKKLYKPFSKVKINIGKPMNFEQYRDKKGDRAILDSLSKQIMEQMIYLTNEAV